MTVKEEIHQLVDELPEGLLESALSMLENLSENDEDDEPLSPEGEASLALGLEDIRAGRVTAWEDVKKELDL